MSSEASWPLLEGSPGRERIQTDVEPLILASEEAPGAHVVHRPSEISVQIVEEQWKTQKA